MHQTDTPSPRRLSPQAIGIGVAVGSVAISGITMITALVPGLSAVGAAVFLDEPLAWNLLLGLGLVTTGILFGVRQAKSLATKTGAACAQSTGASA